MALTKRFNRPKVPTTDKSNDKKDVYALINKGGSVAIQEKSTGDSKPGVVRVQLRLPIEAQQRIDMVRKNQSVKPSRHAWMLEAIYEKLEREEG